VFFHSGVRDIEFNPVRAGIARRRKTIVGAVLAII
jgi:hypothetical protein